MFARVSKCRIGLFCRYSVHSTGLYVAGVEKGPDQARLPAVHPIYRVTVSYDVRAKFSGKLLSDGASVGCYALTDALHVSKLIG